jgi:hypothetical protein
MLDTAFRLTSCAVCITGHASAPLPLNQTPKLKVITKGKVPERPKQSFKRGATTTESQKEANHGSKLVDTRYG